MASHKYTCFMLMLPSAFKLNWKSVSTGAAAIQFPFATRKSKLVKRKCATSPDFPQDHTFIQSQLYLADERAWKFPRQTSLSVFIVAINITSFINIAPLLYWCWRKAVQRLYKITRVLPVPKINIFMSQYLLPINVAESILPSQGVTQRSLLFWGMSHALSTISAFGWTKHCRLLQYFSRCLKQPSSSNCHKHC